MAVRLEEDVIFYALRTSSILYCKLIQYVTDLWRRELEANLNFNYLEQLQERCWVEITGVIESDALVFKLSLSSEGLTISNQQNFK